MDRQMETALHNFKRCAEDAPEGTYEEAKRLNNLLGETVDQFMRDLRALGLKADTCDLAFEVEATLYNYVKRSNPDGTMFPVSEGFGSSMGGPARERVIAQAARDRDCLRDAGAIPN